MRFLTVAQVFEKTSISIPTIWEKVREKKFVQPVKLIDPKRTVWIESEVEQWMADAVAAARA
jgi:predicted DNA-binding transcriptional regulator AlpA